MCGLLFQQHELLVGSMLPSNTLAAPLIDRQACEDVCVASALSADACRTLLWNTVITTDGKRILEKHQRKGMEAQCVTEEDSVCPIVQLEAVKLELPLKGKSNWNCYSQHVVFQK